MKRINKARQRAFLAALAECGQFSEAARASKVDRSAHYLWMEQDPEYPAQVEMAMERAIDKWEDEAKRRAYVGVDEPLVYKGGFCYRLKQVKVIEKVVDLETGQEKEIAFTRSVPFGKPLSIKRYSDGMLMFLLRAKRPAVYGAKLEHSGPGGGPIEIIQRLEAARKRCAASAS